MNGEETARVENKTCPFKQGFGFDTRLQALNTSQKARVCDKAGCQLWVDVKHDRIMVGDKLRFADPEHEYVYTGCGLVHVVPWRLVEKEKP